MKGNGFGCQETEHEQPMQQHKLWILCRFWEEDGIWNGVAQNLPIAVFGSNFEEARNNLKDAIESHVEAMAKAGTQEELLKALGEHVQMLSVDELPFDSPMMRMPLGCSRDTPLAVAQ